MSAQKLKNILSGWKNYLFESDAIESMAKIRSVKCATCEDAVWGLVPQLMGDKIKDIKGMVCNGCKCPLSTKLRSHEEKCPKGLWQPKTL